MSVQSEINRIKDNIANAYTSLSTKGATLPTSQTSTNLKATIDSLDTSNVAYDETTKTLTITIT